MRDKLDLYRRMLMHEPRGHADMYGCLPVPPNDEGADFGVIFMHNAGYSTMCGHAIIALAKLTVEMGWKPVEEPETRVVIDAPCGRIEAFVKIENGKPKEVSFLGVPSFAVALDQQVEVDGYGEVTYDLAFGGTFYAYVCAEKLDLGLDPSNLSAISKLGMVIKDAVASRGGSIAHPFEDDLSFLYGTIFTGPAEAGNIDSRNVCVFAEGELDRSPTGSGVMGRMAIKRAKGEIGLEERFSVESIVGSVFYGSVVKDTRYGGYPAVIPRVEGNAYITGAHEFIIDPADPFREGFFLR